MDDNQPKRPLDPSDFEDDFYDDEFAFDENDPDATGADLPPLSAAKPQGDTAIEGDFAPQEFEDTPENWGEFEDPAYTAAQAAAAMPGAAAMPPRQKSFFMKNFNTIVIGVGVLLGVGVMGSQLMKAPQTAPSDASMEAPMPDMAAVDPSVAGPEAAPPQPSPIAPAEAPPEAAPEQNLTPLPDPGAPAPADNAALAPLDPGPDLGFDAVGVKEGPQEAQQLDDPSLPPPIDGATDVEKPVVELPDPIAFENQPIPTSGPPAEEAPVAAAPAEMAAAEAVPEPAPAPEAPAVVAPANPADPPQMAMNDTPASPLEAPAPVPAPAPEAAASPVVAESALAEDPAAKAALEKLNADKEALAERNKALEDEIKGANGKIDELAAMLAKMEEKIAALENGPGPVSAAAPAASEPAPAVKAEPEPEAEPEAAPVETAAAENILVPAKPTQRPQTPPAAKKPAAKAEPDSAPAPKIAPSSPAETPRWVLRSAQSGRAVVSDRSTGDLRSVQVGDTLRGVGTIQSISSVAGRWVVQGSQGQVRQ